VTSSGQNSSESQDKDELLGKKRDN
jgi:hypothetical protein